MTIDLSHLLDVFVAECREYLQSLDLSLLALDRHSKGDVVDRAALDEVFRATHSLKGMCGMMGYSRMAALAHAMEDSLLGVRDDGEPLDGHRLDTLHACVDGLESSLEQVAATQEEPETLEALAVRVGATTLSGLPDLPQPPAPIDDEWLGSALAPLEGLGDGVLYVRVVLASDTELRGVRAFVVLRALHRIAEVVDEWPTSPEEFTGSVVEARVRGTSSEGVRAALRQLPEIESVVVEPARAAPEPAISVQVPVRVEPTLRVAAGRLDDLMFQMQEVVVAGARLERGVLEHDAPELLAPMAELVKHARRLQASIMQVRMTALEAAFARVPRLARDLAQRLGKDVTVVIDGGDTEVDRSMVDALADPLVHIVRNALDHGIEPPDERVASGKPRTATLRLTARHAAGHVEIEVGDDGRGIDIERVAAAGVESGSLTRADVERARASGTMLELLFRAGVTGARTQSDISGRGVGLDAVRATVRDLGGELSIRTSLGHSTTVLLRLPLTLAVMPALLVSASGADTAIPLDRVIRIERISDGVVREALERHLLTMQDGDAHELVPLGNALGNALDEHVGVCARGRFAVLVQVARGSLALEVDELHGTREIATRPLPAEHRATGPLLGIGILPDGALTTIVDCDRLRVAADRLTEVHA